MNPHTGHLIAAVPGAGLAAGYDQLPQRLEKHAATVLAGRSEARIDLRKNGPLQAWAKKKRKAKAAAKSRRTNRGR